MDNLSVHRAPAIIQQMEELDIPYIFNVPYSPQFNPIEYCFSKIKGNYKRKKLNMLLNGEDLNPVQLIMDSVNKLKKSDIVNCIKLSLSLINK